MAAEHRERAIGVFCVRNMHFQRAGILSAYQRRLERKPTTTKNERECSILAVVGTIIGGGRDGSQRKPRTAENECERSISSIVEAAAKPPTTTKNECERSISAVVGHG